MQADLARRDPEDMNQTIGVNRPAGTYQQASGQAEPGTRTPRRDPLAAFAATLIGAAATGASGWAAGHSNDSYLTSHPLLQPACGVLVITVMALAFTRHRVLTVLAICAAAAVPWIPAIDSLHHA